MPVGAFSASARLFPALLLAGVLACPATAGADLLNGFMEWDYSHLQSKTQDAAGSGTTVKSDAITQKYNLMLNRNFFPSLSLRAGYLFETDQSWLTANDQESHSSITTSLPSADLSLGTPLLNGSFGYYKRKETDTSSGTPSLDLYTEDYHGSFGWRPEGLPYLSLNLERTNSFDGQRSSHDTTNDRAALGLGYLVNGLDLKYQYNYNDLSDKVQGLDVLQETHTGRIAYSTQLFQERVSLYSSYNVSTQSTTTTSSGTGNVDFQLTPFSGLYALNLTPELGGLDQLPALINGDVRTSAGINIGSVLPPQPLRNMGVDLLSPSTVNRILVWLDKRPDPRIVRLFAWDVYASSDNITWTRVTAVPITGLALDAVDNRVELKFPAVTTRYVKVVVAPLNQNDILLLNIPGLTLPLDIFVTEIQAFQEKAAAQVQGETNVTSNILNLDLKVRLLEEASLYYDGSFYLASVAPNGFLRWTLANALMADHRFNGVVSVSGRIAREDSDEPLGRREAYVYNATLRLTPLPTLSHTLAYSGRTESFQGKSNGSNALYLNNTAELYRGVNASLGGGVSFATTDTGEDVDTYNMIFSLNLAPRKDLAMNVNYSLNRTDLTGGALGSAGSTTRRSDLGISYRPFPAVYLLASIGMLEQTGQRPDVVQNYGVNWSPFPDGTLQFNVSYQENVRTLNEERSRLISPSLTWKITSRTTLDLSYPVLRTTSNAGTTTSETLSAILRLSF